MTWLGVVLTGALMALTAPALAQNPYSPAITVNDSAITYYDISQRVLLNEALGARGDLRARAIEQLTEDRLRVQAAEALGVELPEGAIFAGIEEFAAQRGLSVDDVLGVLSARGIDRQTMDDFVEAGLMWREVIQSRFRQRAMPSEDDLDLALSLSDSSMVETVQVSEIALPFAERGEPETIALAERLSRDLARGASFAAAARQYSRSGTAAQGGRMEPVPVLQLPPAIRSQILVLNPGGVTAPIPIAGGLAILRLDSIQQTPRAQLAEVSDEDIRNQLREEIFTQRIASFGQGYLQELLRDALIIEQ
jgi:peptidyl-prolyl cis-trans isomerase SurA